MARLRQRLTYVLVPGLVAVGLFYGLQQVERSAQPEGRTGPALAPDLEAIAEQVTTVRFAADGQLDYILEARRQLLHRNDLTLLEAPEIRKFQDGEARWHITADSGRIPPAQTAGQEIERIELRGNVSLRLTDAGGRSTHLTTQRLDVDPQGETLDTDFPVAMTADGLQQNADGLFADLATEVLTFKRNVRGRYSPTTP